MKKLILCASTLLVSLGIANAQWSSTGVKDDFTNAARYDSVVWSADAPNGASTMSIARTGGAMVITATSIGTGTANQYPTFRAAFSPNVANPSPVNLSAFADIVMDVENVSANLLFAKIELEDATGKKAGIEPNISDVTPNLTWSTQVGTKYPRKAVNGFVLNPNSRATFTIDLSSVPGAVGGLTRTGWGGCTPDGPSCGPVTAYQIDPTRIVAVIFTVNYNDGVYIFSMGTEGGKNHTDDYILDPIDATSYTGQIKIHDFRIGNFVTAGITEAAINNSLKVYPNPASDVLNVAFNADAESEVSLTDIVGNKVFSTTANKGDNSINVNTSDLSAGMYILNINTEKGRVARKVTIK